MKILLILILSLGLLSFTVGCNKRNPEKKIDHISKKISKKLQFSDAQNQKLDEIATYMKSTIKDRRENKKGYFSFIKDQLQKDSIDKQLIDSKFNETMNRMKKHYDEISSKIIALHKTLTPEQKAKLLKFTEKMEKRKRKYFH